MQFNKLICCAAAALTAVIGMPLGVSAQQPLDYTVLEDGTAEIFCKDTSITAAEIPAEIDGYTVTALAKEGFSGCTALQSVTLPETLTTIGESAFNDCASLEFIAIPAQVTSIGSFVFEGCTALTAITVDDANAAYMDDDGVLYTVSQGELVRYPAAREGTSYTVAAACRTIDPWAFTYCSKLQYLAMDNVVAIGADAFMYSESLQTVVLSEGIRELIGASFAYCVNLRKVTLPSTLESIGNKCFYGCVSLPSVTLPDSLTTIGEMAFYGCVQMKEVTVPPSVKTIGNMGIGYSVDPDTNENTVISGFTMHTTSGTKAYSYAKKNGIAYSASVNKSTAILVLAVVLVVLAAGAACLAVFFRRQREAEQFARQKEAERRARKAEKKQNRKS